MKVNVLGTEYDLEEQPREQLPDYADGYCDDSVRKIVVSDFAEQREKSDKERLHDGVKGDLDRQNRKNKRHEIIHAFLFESGLAENSSWAQNEEMVDWWAIQGPKVYKAWQKAGGL